MWYPNARVWILLLHIHLLLSMQVIIVFIWSIIIHFNVLIIDSYKAAIDKRVLLVLNFKKSFVQVNILTLVFFRWIAKLLGTPFAALCTAFFCQQDNICFVDVQQTELVHRWNCYFLVTICILTIFTESILLSIAWTWLGLINCHE